MIIQAHSFDIFSRHFGPTRRAQPTDEIELLPIAASHDVPAVPLPECKLSKTIAQQRSKQSREKILTDSAALKQTGARKTVKPASMLSKVQVHSLLQKISAMLQHRLADEQINAMLAQLLEAVGRCGSQQIGLELWDTLARDLKALSLAIDKHANPQSQHVSVLDFPQLNINYLQQVSHYAHLQLAHDALVQIFAREIERQAVENPALCDIETTRLSLEVSLPVPLLSAGGELSYATTRALDDEGNLVSTTAVTGGLTCKVSALFASAKGKALGSYAQYAYCKTSEDHARTFFKQLLDNNRCAPDLEKYLCCAGGDPVAELVDFDNLQKKYLLQQAHYSQYFSILLGLSEPGQLSDGEQRANADSARVNLQAVPANLIRMTKGTITAGSLSAEGSVGLLPLQAGIALKGKRETKRSSRILTLCELLRHHTARAEDKARIRRRVLEASAGTLVKVSAFWYGAASPAQQTMRRNVDCLIQDWESYSTWHAGLAQGHASTDLVLAGLHGKYGAADTEDCLRRLALLVARFYLQLLEQPDTAANRDLMNRLLALEKALHNSSIPNARKILARHALVRQRIEYVTDETSTQFTVGEASPMGGTAPGVKIVARNVRHYNPLRAGEYVTVEYATGTNLAMNQRLLKSIADYFNVGATGLGKHFGGAADVQCGVHTLRFFRPAAFAGLSFVKQYERRTEQHGTQFGATVPIPVTGAVNLQASLHHARVANHFVSETPGTDSVLYFAMHFMHALSSGKTSMDGTRVQDSYWYRLEREHAAALEQLFLNYARDLRSQTGLIKELDMIEQGWSITPAELQQSRASSSAFLVCAARLEQERSPENYQLALAQFKEMLVTYYPQWLRKKEGDKAYKKWQFLPALSERLFAF